MKRTICIHPVFHVLKAALILLPLMLALACEGPAGPRGETGRDGDRYPDIQKAVSAALGAKTQDDEERWTVKVSGIDLSDDYAVENLFHGIAAGIEGEDLIILDLSDCGGWNMGFNPGIPPADKSRFAAIILPASLTDINDGMGVSEGAFTGFSALESVTAPGLLSVGNYAFYNCTKLAAINLPNVSAIGDYAFACIDRNVKNEGLTELVLPKVRSIGKYAFQWYAILEKVELQEAVSIDDYGFWNCPAIDTLVLPKVATIGDYAFAQSGTGASPNSVLGRLDLPEALSIGNYAFSQCIVIESVSLPKALSVGQYVFSGQSAASGTALKTVDLSSVTEMGAAVFRYCTGLETLKLGPEVPTIGGSFAQTSSVGSITITVPAAAADAYSAAGWVNTAANGNTAKWGGTHKAIIMGTY